MPFLPARTRRRLGSPPTVVLMVIRQTSAGIFEFQTTGAADLEIADITGTGQYVLITAGTYPSAPRILARLVNGTTLLIY